MGILWYGGFRVIQGAMTPGTLFSFVTATLMLYGPVRKLARIANLAQQTTPAAERIFEILALQPAVADARTRSRSTTSARRSSSTTSGSATTTVRWRSRTSA